MFDDVILKEADVVATASQAGVQGGFVALLPAFVADTFGKRSLGAVLGVLYTSRGMALFAAPPALALGIAIVAGHVLPVMAASLLGLLGTLLLARVQPSNHTVAVRREVASPGRAGVRGCTGSIHTNHDRPLQRSSGGVDERFS